MIDFYYQCDNCGSVIVIVVVMVMTVVVNDSVIIEYYYGHNLPFGNNDNNCYKF